VRDKAVQYVQSHTKKPWFLYVAPTAPHAVTCTQPDLDSSCKKDFPQEAVDVPFRNTCVPPPQNNLSNAPEADRTDKPQYVQDAPVSPTGRDDVLGPDTQDCGSTRVRAQQLRMLKSVDLMVNDIFSAMSTAQANNTLAFFVSDNGFLWYEHGLNRKPHAYYEDVRVPMLMRWPGHAAQVADNTLVSSIDIAPTALAAAGRTIPPDIDGQDLLVLNRPPRDHLLVERVMRNVTTGAPTWASLWKAPPSTSTLPAYEYTEYYDDPVTPFVDERFVEYYDMVGNPPSQPGDALQLTNVFHDASTSNDLPPEIVLNLMNQLASDKQCAGHGAVPNPSAPGTYYPPCP
jgi:arylsulfatase A-like enzyme